jgi:hypothetical protein
MLLLRYEPAAVTRWCKTLDDDRRAPLPCRKISFSHGAEWKALISKYIGAIPVSGDASCAAEQSMSGMAPPWIPVSGAMIAKLGAAASDIQSAARSTGRPCLSPFWFI